MQIIGQQFDNPSIAPEALSPGDRQRVDLLRQRSQRLKKQADDVRKANLTKKIPDRIGHRYDRSAHQAHARHRRTDSEESQATDH